ncbi:MAG TPA: NTP transferase domain-containing protein [Solirubrobacterales bacterium]|jgi:molybdopterin-guanine dinucleotide biosynthesis protein A
MAKGAETAGGLESGEALGAVLAGGRGSRIGGAKATAELAGRPLISYPLAALAAAGIEPFVVAKPASALPPLSCPVIREPELPRHPLCGIVAALRAAEGRPVVVVACDMPLAAPPLLAHLAAANGRLLVPAPAGRLQPLQARYAAELLAALEAALEREEPLRRTVESLTPSLLGEEEIARFGNPGRLFFNVNDGDDLRHAEQLLAAQ